MSWSDCITSTGEVYDQSILLKHIRGHWRNEEYKKRETLKVFCLNIENELIGMYLVRGAADTIRKPPLSVLRETLKLFLSDGMVKLIVVHNHPVGWFWPERLCVWPSPDDIRYTMHLAELCIIAKVKLVASIIITENKSTFIKYTDDENI